MNVVMLSRTPLAGAPYENMKCLKRYTNIHVRWIALKNNYNDGRSFPCDLLWPADTSECLEVMKKADLFHVHNEVFPLPAKFMGKPMLVQFHSVPLRPAQVAELGKWSKHRYTVQQPMQLREYNLEGLPNMMDPVEYFPSNGVVRNQLKIVFAPTNSWGPQAKGSKAASEVASILDEFKEIVELDIFSNVSYTDNLQRKQHADILIDDVVNHTFHKTSMEGACFGTAVLTSSKESGFFFTTLDTLRGNLRVLLKNTEQLKEFKLASRKWIETNWHPSRLCDFYVRAYDKVLNKGG